MLGAALILLAAPVRAGDLCLVPSSANGRIITVDCATGSGFSPLYTGYADTIGLACVVNGCTPGITDCGCGMTGEFQWNISRSATDPYDTTGPLGGNVLYLWLSVCTVQGDGFWASEFALGGSLQVQAFLPRPGWTNYGTAGDLLMLNDGGCLPSSSPYLVGDIQLAVPVSVDRSVYPSRWGTVKARYR